MILIHTVNFLVITPEYLRFSTVYFSDTVRLAIRKITYAPERPLPQVSVISYTVFTRLSATVLFKALCFDCSGLESVLTHLRAVYFDDVLLDQHYTNVRNQQWHYIVFIHLTSPLSKQVHMFICCCIQTIILYQTLFNSHRQRQTRNSC